MSVRFNDSAIVSVKGNDHRTHFWYISKNEEIKFSEKLKMKNTYLKKKWITVKT